MDCPKCGADLTGAEPECPSCGVIISKAQASPRPSQSYEYLVVPFHGSLRAGQGFEVVSSQLEDLINHYAAYGWQLDQVASVSLTVSEGCLGAFLGRSNSQDSYDQVVFRRAVNQVGRRGSPRAR